MYKKINTLLFVLFTISNINTQTPDTGQASKVEKPDTVQISKDAENTTITWGDKSIVLLGDTLKSIPELTLSLGFNFDFLSGVKSNDLYADVNADIPFLFAAEKVKKKPEKFINQLGIEVGAFQLRTISNIEDTILTQYRLTEPDLEDGELVGIHFITVNTENSAIISRDNLGLYFQPKWTFHYKESKDYLSRVSLIGHCEWYRSDIELNYTFSTIASRDTSSTAPEEWPRPYDTVEEIPSFQGSIIQENLINVGVGLDLLLKRPSGILQFKPIVGINSISINKNPNNLIDDLDEVAISRRRLFYMVQAEFIEQKVLGLKLAVEIRGFGAPDASNVVGRIADLPQFSVSLSKQFSLEKIAELFTTK
ncbi:hypothetical protein [Lewinella cohaerens]|uniref:hypothetical protein n=1 Tax=Lewinella cohaerens TaxID=70995 RepID=UPI00037E4169|nr:hypothetical protein [Lewinella cohaerens]